MGGKNHQPCSVYLRNSTQLSRCVSEAYVALEQANVALEDIILAELDGDRVDIQPISAALQSSLNAITAAEDVSLALRDQMKENDFVDLPTLKTADLGEMGRSFIKTGMVNSRAWSLVRAKMEKGGFVFVLDHFDARLVEIKKKSQALLDQVGVLESPARNGRIVDIMEKNRDGNIKMVFAQLYTAWSNFHEEFLASSMISPELWYSSRGYGSLLQETSASTLAFV